MGRLRESRAYVSVLFPLIISFRCIQKGEFGLWSYLDGNDGLGLLMEDGLHWGREPVELRLRLHDESDMSI